MIRLTSAQQARSLHGKIPSLAITRMEQFEGCDGRYDPERHGHIVVLGAGDDIVTLSEVSDSGLLAVLDPECPGYEFLEAYEEDGRTVWEMAIAIDEERTIAVIFSETHGLDPRLTAFLDQLETERRRFP